MVTPNRPTYTAQPREVTAQSSASLGVLLALCGLVIPGAIAYGMGTANELQVLAVVLGAIGIASLFASPFFGLVVFAGLLYTRPEESVKALAGMHLTLVIAVMTLIGMILQMMLSREKAVRSPTIGMVIGFAAAAVLSCLVNGVGFMPSLDFIRLVVLVILVLNLVRTPERYRVFVTVLIFFTCYLAL